MPVHIDFVVNELMLGFLELQIDDIQILNSLCISSGPHLGHLVQEFSRSLSFTAISKSAGGEREQSERGKRTWRLYSARDTDSEVEQGGEGPKKETIWMT